MIRHWVLFDDRDGEVLASRLTALAGGSTRVIPVLPPGDLLSDPKTLLKRSNDHPELFLVDYELDTGQADGSIANYRGTTLAARLRDLFPEVPIVLFTRSTLPTWTAAKRTVKAGGAFDATMYKDTDLRANPESVKATLRSLANGFKVLRETSRRTTTRLLELLDADERGQAEAQRVLPPTDGWRAVEASQWVRGVLLSYPGILYNASYASVALGVSRDSLRRQDLLSLLEPAEYHGVFSTEDRHWWRHSLFEIVCELSSSTTRSAGSRDAFRLAANEILGDELAPSVDEETRMAPDTVCYILDIPTRIESSLPYRPDSRPAAMDQARVSFRAIRESNDVNELYLDETGRFLLDEIRLPGS